tara:strand:+ start:286 stop:828 length:543 start_codon:yes stop_codon:yes gene_type:complete
MDRTYQQLSDERAVVIGDKQYGYQNAYKKKCDDDSFRNNAIKGIYSKNMLNQIYFSDANVQKIQNLIRYDVYNMSKKQFTISEQDKTQLQIVMRSIYLQYSRNLDTDIPKQVSELNKMISDYLVPKIISNIKQYLKYLQDKNGTYTVMEHPKNVSSAGLKSLRIDSAMGFGNNSMKLFQE